MKWKLFRITIGITVIIFILCYPLLGTSAFLSDAEHAVNSTSIGYNDTSIKEEFPSPDPIEPEKESIITKKVSITNQDSVNCFIRVSIDYSDADIGNQCKLNNLDTTNWIFIPKEGNPKLGGFYYYTKAVNPGESTTTLFDSVTISSGADYQYHESGDSFQIIVYEESIQEKEGLSYEQVWDRFIQT